MTEVFNTTIPIPLWGLIILSIVLFFIGWGVGYTEWKKEKKKKSDCRGKTTKETEKYPTSQQTRRKILSECSVDKSI